MVHRPTSAGVPRRSDDGTAARARNRRRTARTAVTAVDVETGASAGTAECASGIRTVRCSRAALWCVAVSCRASSRLLRFSDAFERAVLVRFELESHSPPLTQEAEDLPAGLSQSPHQRRSGRSTRPLKVTRRDARRGRDTTDDLASCASCDLDGTSAAVHERFRPLGGTDEQRPPASTQAATDL